jgi:hypothetical protein
MIDSVCLTLPVRMHSPREMSSLGFASVCRHPSVTCAHPARWRFHPPNRPHLTWSEAPDRSHWLSVTGSLPRFLFGSNVYLISNDDELRTCLGGISEYVGDNAQVHFDSLKANVTRVDYCKDWQLTSELVPQYLWSLRNVSLPRMHRTVTDNCTVQLSNASQTICFYDKFEERTAMKSRSDKELNAAKGILRFEMRLRDNRSCSRHAATMGLRNRSAEALLNREVANRTITTTLERLGLNKPLRAGSRRFELLRAHFPNDNSKVIRLMGFLAVCDHYGADNLVTLGLCSYTDFRRKLAEVKAAGAYYEVDGPVSLAPLTTLHSREMSKGSEAA